MTFKDHLISILHDYIKTYNQKPTTIYLDYAWLLKVYGITSKQYFNVRFPTDLEYLVKNEISFTFPYLENIPIKIINDGIEKWYKLDKDYKLESFIYISVIVINDITVYSIIDGW